MNATIDSRHQRPAMHHRASASVVLPRVDARFLPRVVLLLALVLLLSLGLRQLSTPDVVPVTAPATAFSAARAMEQLRVLAAEPRAIGSPGHANAQEYLVDQLRSLGLEPEVQLASVGEPGQEGTEGVVAARVSNIIARLPGTDSTGRSRLTRTMTAALQAPVRAMPARAWSRRWRRCALSWLVLR
jgi:hypothetical protein